MELKIKSVSRLSEIMESSLGSLQLFLPLSAIDTLFVNDLLEVTTAYPGKTNLQVTVTDYEEDPPIRIDLFSRNIRIDPSRKLIDYLEGLPFAELKIHS